MFRNKDPANLIACRLRCVFSDALAFFPIVFIARVLESEELTQIMNHLKVIVGKQAAHISKEYICT